MPDSAVADAGGLLVLAGLLEGQLADTAEILALDATARLLAEYLALHHEGAPVRARRDFRLVTRTVSEWFPVRGLAMEAVLMAGEDMEVDSVASLALAEHLRVPLITKNRELTSSKVAVLWC
jgi:hypothetical protein